MDAIGQAIEWSAFMSVLLMFALAYFVGHLLTWVARGGKRHKNVGFWVHLLETLRFRPPKAKAFLRREAQTGVAVGWRATPRQGA